MGQTDDSTPVKDEAASAVQKFLGGHDAWKEINNSEHYSAGGMGDHTHDG